MKLRSIILLLSVLISSAMAFSQTTSPVIDSISEGGAIIINVPETLMKRLCPPRAVVAEKADTVAAPAYAAVPEKTAVATPTGKMGGYRIQVFSDNNSRTAKSEARSRARDISAQFPQYATYVVYNSPYWRLRVGNFRTQEEANAAAHSLKAAFPAYSREIRVVKDTITLSRE